MSSELAILRHSVNITVGNKTINTWDDWHIVPTKRPVVSLPTVKTQYIDIPGSNGRLDFTEVLAGEPLYNDREGSWEFVILNGYQEWHVLYETIKNFLHGKEATVVLDDAPEYQYKGRLSFDSWDPGEHNSNITISYVFAPYKSYAAGETADWRWDDLTFKTDDYIIYYGTFDVSGEKPRNLYNPTTDEVALALTSSATMNVEYHGNIYTFSIGGEITYINGVSSATMEHYDVVTPVVDHYDEVLNPTHDSYEPVSEVEGTNPAEIGWYEKVDESAYILTEDTSPDPEKTYYEFVKGDDPQALGWYEKVDETTYILSTDTSVDTSKTYYEFVEGNYDNPRANGWYEIVGSVYVLTADISVNPNKTYYELVKDPDFISQIMLGPGDNECKFIGDGRVTLSYYKGAMI